MPFRIFTLPVADPSDAEKELDDFLKTVKMVNIRWEFVPDGQGSFWTALVNYFRNGETPYATARKSQIDYRDILSPEDFAVFAKLRKWRNAIAEKDGAPPFTVFNNEQIATMAQKRIKSLDELKQLEGVGDIRLERYGKTVLDIIASFKKSEKTQDEAKSEPLQPDS